MRAGRAGQSIPGRTELARMRQADEIFEEHRPALARLAYRMLGSLADADDVVQEAYLRWIRTGRDAVQSPRAYLLSIVTRLCIDERQKVESRKLTYVGPWLPEPVVELAENDPGAPLETAESVSMALLLVLESLSPVERAAYLLRRIFEYDYDCHRGRFSTGRSRAADRLSAGRSSGFTTSAHASMPTPARRNG